MGYQFDDIKNCSYVIKKSKRKKNSLVEENLRDIVLKNEFIEFEKKTIKRTWNINNSASKRKKKIWDYYMNKILVLLSFIFSFIF